MFEQAVIGVCGIAAIFLSQDRRESWRRWACIFGLASQPAWLYMTWHAHQWGVFMLSCLYAFAWARGFATHWIGRRRA